MNASAYSKIKAVQSFIELVQTFADTKILKSEIEKLSKVDTESYHDDNGFDVLHHAIISNNIEAVTILFLKGYFLPPHEYHSLSYVHLAAKLGYRSILGLLLQDRPHDNIATVFKYQSASQNQYRYTKLNKDDDEQAEVTPLDIAGRSGHIGCVKLILDHCLGLYHGRGRFSGKDAHINMACQLDSPFALRLLLSQSVTDDELQSAVGAALKLAKPECLDILLRLCPDLSSLFGGMNLYHVLYSYSLSFDKKWVEALPSVTAVLIRNGHSIMSSVPFRTYPLYSLICLFVKCYDMPDTLPYIIACLVVLLNAGASPNFDEIEFEMAHEREGIQTAFGRLAYSTALHCLFGNICCLRPHTDSDALRPQADSDATKEVKDMLQQCTELLMRHGANLQQIGRVKEDGSLMGTAFHAFFDMSLLVGLDVNTFSLLLKYGADPDIECDGRYPLSIIILECLYFCNPTMTMALTKEDISIIFGILDIMSYETIKQIMDTTTTYERIDSGTQREFKSILLEKMRDTLSRWTLKKRCQYSILKSCQRKMDRILKLPLPMSLKNEILDGFILNVV